MTRFYWDKSACDWVEYERSAPQPRVFIWSDLKAYKSPLGTGVIEGRAARREDMKRGNCCEVDPSEYTPRLVGPENVGRSGYDPDFAKDYYEQRKRDGGDRADSAFVP
jgi:hypothetical protein